MHRVGLLLRLLKAGHWEGCGGGGWQEVAPVRAEPENKEGTGGRGQDQCAEKYFQLQHRGGGGAGGGRSARCGTIAETEEDGAELSPAPVPRTRAATISTSPTKVPRSAPIPPPAPDRGGGAAISPQFLFLQLYQAAGLPTNYTEKPLLLPATKSIESSLRNLDRIFCYETHKVGVLYVGPGQQNDEKAILRFVRHIF